MKNLQDIKLGILGAGQLGRMLAQEASKLDINIHFLDKSASFPAAKLSRNLHIGDFKNYDDVMAFGRQMDVISIEIENVNTDALFELEAMGKQVFPQARVIALIKDKGLQKQFYATHRLPSSPFVLIESKAALLDKISKGDIKMPFVQKSREAGYDGKGVAVISDENDIDKIMDTPSVIENLVDIDKELAVIVGRTKSGQIISFPTVEMVFNPEGNLLDYLLSPALVSAEIDNQCRTIAEEIAEKLDITGILAVELFLDTSGALLINEVAPRTHNSGHHTIDAQQMSQFALHLRTIMDMPLLEGQESRKAMMINLLGEANEEGPVYYEGLDTVIKMKDVYLHLYGKEQTKPLRKMGHITILFDDIKKAKEKANFVKANLKVRACQNIK